MVDPKPENSKTTVVWRALSWMSAPQRNSYYYIIVGAVILFNDIVVDDNEDDTEGAAAAKSYLLKHLKPSLATWKILSGHITI